MNLRYAAALALLSKFEIRAACAECSSNRPPRLTLLLRLFTRARLDRNANGAPKFCGAQRLI